MRAHLLCQNVNIVPLLTQLEANPELWGAHHLRKDIGVDKPHKEMSDIWVRYNDIKKYHPKDPTAFNDEHIPIWYPAWSVLTALHPLIFDLMAFVRGEMLGGILITRIPPRGKIAPHVDTGWHVEYYDKFYLALKAPVGAVFAFQDEQGGLKEEVKPKPGDLHLIDNRKRHWVENNSDEERITLIMCIRTQLFGRR